MKTIEELEAELETVTRERDLSLSAWESAGMTGRDAQSAMLELARQLEEARAIVGSCWLTYSEGERDKARAWAHQCERERDEARAEVERWRTSYEAASSHAVDVRAMLDQVRKELYEARCEVDRLMHQLADQTNETTRVRLEAKRAGEDAYRRGAEAMREACARWFATSQVIWMEPDEYIETANDIRALPIPEEP